MPAAVTLHCIAFASLWLYKPTQTAPEIIIPIELSLLEIARPEPDPQEEPPPAPETSEPEADLPEPTTTESIASASVPISPATAEAIESAQPLASSAPASSGLPEVDTPALPEDWQIDGEAVWFGPPQDAPTGEIAALRSLRCLRLGRDEPADGCVPGTVEGVDGIMRAGFEGQFGEALTGENPFASALERFSDSQYQDRSTTYSTHGRRAGDHQHSNPFFSHQSSAERDLTGSLNSVQHPGD